MCLGSGFPVRLPVTGRLRRGPGILVSWIVLTAAAQANAQGGSGALEVEPGTGAVSLCLPLGPGIGRADLRYVPVLVGRFAPRVAWAWADPTAAPDPSGQAGFELSPGDLELWCKPGADAMDALAARWTYPDGSGGCTREEPRTGASVASIWAAFGYGSAQGPEASVASCPNGPAEVLAGRGGDILVALPEAETAPTLEGPLGDVGFPRRLLTVRGTVAYEYHWAGVGGAKSDPVAARSAYYRLAAMRATGRDVVTFSYGPNGVDFQADWDGWTLRVTWTEGSATGPGAGHDAVTETAQLRVSYAGPVTVPGYTLQVVARPGEPIRRQALRVSRIEGWPAGKTTHFGYGPVPAVGPVGTGGVPGPTVLRSIELPNRSLQLEWEGWCESGAGGAGTWMFGLTELRDQVLPDSSRGADEQVYRREPGGAGGTSTAAGDRRWVRQSRHFVFGSASGQGGCQTFVRDRWNLGDTAPRTRGVAEAVAVEIPTFTYDEQAGRLISVPGQFTRCMDWDSEAIARDQPPDPHEGWSTTSSGRAGLRGGTQFQDTLAAMQAAAAKQAALARDIEARRAAQAQAAMEQSRRVQQQMQHSREVARQMLEARMRQNTEEEAKRQALAAAESAARARAAERADAEARRVRVEAEQRIAAANQKAADAALRAAQAKRREEEAQRRILAAEQRAAAAREKGSRPAPGPPVSTSTTSAPSSSQTPKS